MVIFKHFWSLVLSNHLHISPRYKQRNMIGNIGGQYDFLTLLALVCGIYAIFATNFHLAENDTME